MAATMKVHLIDGTYELFRQHFGMVRHHEQLARGVDFASNRAIFRALARAIHTRATSPIGRGETPFQHNPSFPECRVSVAPDDFIELRVSG
jgi:hypothetical protein